MLPTWISAKTQSPLRAKLRTAGGPPPALAAFQSVKGFHPARWLVAVETVHVGRLGAQQHLQRLFGQQGDGLHWIVDTGGLRLGLAIGQDDYLAVG